MNVIEPYLIFRFCKQMRSNRDESRRSQKFTPCLHGASSWQRRLKLGRTNQFTGGERPLSICGIQFPHVTIVVNANNAPWRYEFSQLLSFNSPSKRFAASPQPPLN